MHSSTFVVIQCYAYSAWRHVFVLRMLSISAMYVTYSINGFPGRVLLHPVVPKLFVPMAFIPCNQKLPDLPLSEDLGSMFIEDPSGK